MSVMSVDTGYWTGSITYDPPGPFAPVNINVGYGPDANGIAWIWEKLDGWDSPDVTGQIVQRGSDHGGWAAGQWYAARSMTWTLRASAPTQALRDTARALLQQCIPVNDLALFVYNEPIPKQMWVRRSGRIQETYDNLTEVEFTCVMVAPDPRKYATVLKNWSSTSLVASAYFVIGPVGGENTVPFAMPNATAPATTANSNLGNFETRPVITITGPLHAPGIMQSSTGMTVSWSQLNLAVGDILLIDMDSRMAWLNPGSVTVDVPLQPQQPLTGYVAADIWSAWFTMQPGLDAIQLLSGASIVTDTGVMVVRSRDAWI
jgi:hypothetical protein